MIPYCYSDGGEHKSGLRANNDCCVRAFALCTGKNYEETLHFLARFGWRSYRGMENKEIRLAARQYGNFKVRGWRGRVGQLESKINRNKNYIVGVRGHVFCVCKGVVVDSFAPKMRQKIDMFLEFSPR